MPYPDLKDVGVVAAFERWGFPYHGLAEAGVVAVSGHAVTQPAGGSIYTLHVPGAPLANSTPAEIAADAALGMAWEDYVVIAGSSQQIYGSTNLGPFGWIYASSDGRRWWIKMTSALSAAGNSHTFTFSVTLFGEFSESPVPETYSRSVIVSDLGQAVPYAKISTWSGLTETVCDLSAYTFFLEDISANGAQAILALRNTTCAGALTFYTPGWLAHEPIPMGFLSIDVADSVAGPIITISTLYDRATTLGVFTDSVDGDWKIENRILAACFSTAGVVQPLKLSMDFPVNLVQDSLACPGSASASSSANFTWTFDWGGHVTTYTASMSAIESETCYEVTDGSGTHYQTSTDRSGSYTAFGGLLSGARSLSGLLDTAGGSATVSFLSVNDILWGVQTPNGVYPGAGFFSFVENEGTGVNSGQQFYWAIKRLSNKYFGFLAMKDANGAALYSGPTWLQTNDMVWIGGITPAGADSFSGNLGILTNVVPSGTTHPITHAPVLRPAGTALCYV